MSWLRWGAKGVSDVEVWVYTVVETLQSVTWLSGSCIRAALPISPLSQQFEFSDSIWEFLESNEGGTCCFLYHAGVSARPLGACLF